ncbi:MAG: cytochrome b N-terminal domain-containing protein [Minicystis sp.]
MSRLGDWLDERTGHRALLRHVLDEPLPGGARWSYVWGSALTISLLTQAVTGWLLMSAYTPSATTAWSSVAYIHHTLSAGWILRGLHHFGAQAMIVLLAAHLMQTALYGAYRKPRELNWYFGLGLLLVTLAFSLTGYLLPWDQKGYWATRVATNIVGTIPLLGAPLQRVLVGGPEYGHLTLTHFYTLHVGLLPAAVVLLLVAHIALFRRHGLTPPVSADLRKVDRFYPKQVWRDLVVSLFILLLLFAVTAVEHGAPLDAPADPASDYPARPEWYFLPLFELLKYFKGALEPIGAVGIPLLVLGYLFALPFLDKGPDRSLKARFKLLLPLALFGLIAGALTVQSRRVDSADASFQRARTLASERAARSIALFRRGVPPEGPLAMLHDDPETRGQELFVQHCATCHRLGALGPSAEKATAPALDGYGTKAWVLSLLDDPDADRYFGKTPFKGLMPSLVRPPADPEASKLFKPMSPADQAAVAAFLEAQAQGESGKGSPGETLVRQRCTGCHRLDGKTDDEDSPAPELRGWASEPWIAAQIENPGGGKAYPPSAMSPDLQGHMPAFGEKLSPKERKMLGDWLRGRTRDTAAK